MDEIATIIANITEPYEKALVEAKKKIDRFVDSQCKILDEAVERILRHPDPANISVMELERACLEIPALIYRLEELLSSSQLELDIADMLEKHVYQVLMKETKGTVAEKQAVAFIGTEKFRIQAKLKGYYVNRLKNKRAMAEKVFDGVRKVLSVRINSFNVVRKDTLTS